MKTLDSLLIDLILVLKKQAEKPYLPVYGEIFIILKEVKKIAKKTKEIVTFYEIHPTGVLKYDYKKKIFVIEIPELSINLKEDELVESIIKGRFHPKEKIF